MFVIIRVRFGNIYSYKIKNSDKYCTDLSDRVIFNENDIRSLFNISSSPVMIFSHSIISNRYIVINIDEEYNIDDYIFDNDNEFIKDRLFYEFCSDIKQKLRNINLESLLKTDH